MAGKEHYYFVVPERENYGGSTGTSTGHETYAVDAMPFTWFRAFRDMEYVTHSAPPPNPTPPPSDSLHRALSLDIPYSFAPSYMLLRFERISKDEYLDAVENGGAYSMSDIRARVEKFKDQNTGTGSPYR